MKVILCNSAGVIQDYSEPGPYRVDSYLNTKGYISSVYDLRLKINQKIRPLLFSYLTKVNSLSNVNSLLSNPFIENELWLLLQRSLFYFCIKNNLSAGDNLNFYDEDLKKVIEKIIISEIEIFIEFIIKERPDIIGFFVFPRIITGFNSDQMDYLMSEYLIVSYIARRIRYYSNKIIFGYTQIKLSSYDFISSCMLETKSELDLWITGNPEKTVEDLILAIIHKKSIKKISDSQYIDHINKTVIINKGKKEKHFIYTTPVYPLQIISEYKRMIPSLKMLVEGSSGCSLTCKFCHRSKNSEKYLIRSTTETVNEILTCQNNYGVNRIRLYDNIINGDIKRFKTFCIKLIKSGFNGEIEGYMALCKGMTKDIIKLASSAGIKNVRLSIESGSNRILKMMGKDITSEKSEQLLRTCSDSGMKITAAFMTDYPGETEKDFIKTLEFIRRNNHCINGYTLSSFIPDENFAKIHGLNIEALKENISKNNRLIQLWNFVEDLRKNIQ